MIIAENFGVDLDSARAVILIFHGKGGNVDKMRDTIAKTGLDDVACFAPTPESGGPWWYSGFETPLAPDDPGLVAALAVLDAHVNYLLGAGFDYSDIVIAGFSQGAALVLEHIATQPHPYAGVVSMSGALLGTVSGDTGRYTADLSHRSVEMSIQEGDTHVPIGYVEESRALLEALGARVRLAVEPGAGHSIKDQDIDALVRVANRVETISLLDSTDTGAVGDGANSTIIGNLMDNRLMGRDGSDLLLGREGNDYLDGGAQSDELRGGIGNDEIRGGGGRDSIEGGGGNDRIEGMRDADWLKGDSGNDRFIYLKVSDSTPSAPDLIVDFEPGGDVLDLRAIDAVRSTTRDDAFQYIGEAEFTGEAGQLRLHSGDQISYFEADVTGDALADVIIRVASTGVPAEADIWL